MNIKEWYFFFIQVTIKLDILWIAPWTCKQWQNLPWATGKVEIKTIEFVGQDILFQYCSHNEPCMGNLSHPYVVLIYPNGASCLLIFMMCKIKIPT